MKYVKDILFELELLVPMKHVMEGDNCGLLIGDLQNPVTCCIMALDVTEDILKLAVKQGAELIITHHPVIYDPLYNIKQSTIVHRLIRSNINVICVHSSLDIVDNGVNGALAKQLNLTGVKLVKGTDGMGRVGRLKRDLSGIDLARYAKAMLNSSSVQVVNPDNMISTVAVLGGSGGSYIQKAFESADAYITGEVKHSDYVYAMNTTGKTLITVGHHHSEVQVLNQLKAQLKTVLNEIVFIVDEKYPVIEV